MHVAVDLNLNWFLQLIVTILIVALGLHRLVKNTASKYFVVDATFDSSSSFSGGADTPSFKTCSSNNSNRLNNNNNKKNMAEAADSCALCGNSNTKKCSRCKMVSYCSEACQRSHWISEHKTKCMKLQSSGKADIKHSSSTLRGKRASSAISLVPCTGTSKFLNQSKKILFPYEEFVELFNWKSSGFPPCGLLNCGNSCFANVVLQCLAYTKPLVAYLLEKGHRRECRRNDWCFLCEFQTHLEKASQSLHPFSPLNILSRLPNIGGNLGYGSQEDAHEFMRFAIDTMQSVCLDEFGGEKAVHPSSQETTLIQHIFGGRLQSQVICTKCNSISDQLENMMDLTVEIQGDAASLEECLDQFTTKEWLHGENMYKCDRCNDYVTAWKCLTIQLPPNILTIALKRFQSGRFGKLNKRVTFPETLDLSPYTSKPGDDDDIYKLYAVIVHVDMLNASFFGHYICYIKDFCGNWYRIDDCKVARVDVDEVLSQGAYMLLYSRVSPRATCLYPFESKREGIKKNVGQTEELQPSPKQNAQRASAAEYHGSATDSCVLHSTKITSSDFICVTSSEDVKEKIDMEDSERISSDIMDFKASEGRSGNISSTCKYPKEADVMKFEPTSHISGLEDEPGRMKTSHSDGYPSNNNLSFTHNGVCGKVETPLDLSSCLGEPGHVSACSGHTQNGAVKSEGADCSGAKLKPLFRPGFLVKSTRNKSEMKNLEVSERLHERACGTMSCGPSSEFTSSGLCLQNGVIANGDKPYFGYKDESSCNILNKPGEGLHDLRFNESAEANLRHGDSGSPIASNGSIDITNTDDRDIVLEENLTLDG